MRNRGTGGFLWLLVMFFCCVPALAGAQDDPLASLALENLMDVEVITASRRTEPLTQVAGAVTVLNEDDIFTSGAKSVPELLRLVPGVHVAQVDTDKWAIGIRGFNGVLSNKHLVLVDGRPVTSPMDAGVAWDAMVPISMVKRVEVVRGTWTHLWGSDSFTGVINVITKRAEETQGGQSVTTGGTTGLEQLIRYGGEMGELGFWRGYLKGGYTTGNVLSGDGGNRAAEDWIKRQGGFRADWENAYTDLLSFQGDVNYSTIKDNGGGGPDIFNPKVKNKVNGYGQLTWNRATGLDSGVNFRTSYTTEYVNVSDLNGQTNTVDAEVEHAVEQMGAHRLTWGVGSRFYWDHISPGDSARMDKKSHQSFSANGYAQDRISLDDSLFLTLGGKLDYFGRGRLEVQPTVRLLHTLEDREIWLAVSRAVRADNRFQREGSYVIDRSGTQYTVVAPENLDPEELYAYEAGFRHRIVPDFQYDISAYINDYQRLIMLEFDSATNTATLGNNLKGTAYGLEVQADWQAAEWLKLTPMASLIYQRLYGVSIPSSNDSMPEFGLGSEFKLQAATKPSSNTGLDVLIGYVDGPTNKRQSGYFLLEAHASWQASESVMVELIGRNLGETANQFSGLKVGPSVDLRLTWDF